MQLTQLMNMRMKKSPISREIKKDPKGGFNPECKRAYATAYTLKLLNNDDAIVKVQGHKYQQILCLMIIKMVSEFVPR